MQLEALKGREGKEKNRSGVARQEGIEVVSSLDDGEGFRWASNEWSECSRLILGLPGMT